ncbi:MAG: NAD(P)H-binding protein [Chloroflexota bacterium]|nr:MAG: hypothetical protein DIU68_07635 [Chloroflexota bacterium]
MAKTKRVLVTGGGTFLGDNIAAALLAEGAEVTLLVRPGAEDRLGPLAQRTRWWTADVWNPGSLKGRARNQDTVIHTVGSMIADPAKGLSHDTLNFVSARNVANMCVSGGVTRMVLISAVSAPWVSRQYIRSKREAERYISRVGLRPTIIRAPVAYMRGKRRGVFYRFLSLVGATPPFSWTWLGRVAPMPIDVLARGVARIALDDEATKRIYYARDLRKRNRPDELNRPLPVNLDDTQPFRPQASGFHLLDEDVPFGWTPPMNHDR